MGSEQPNQMAGLELIADLMGQSLGETATVTSTVIDRLQRECWQLRARLVAVETAVEDLLSKPYVPSARAIEQAVFDPDQRFIGSLVAQYEHAERGA